MSSPASPFASHVGTNYCPRDDEELSQIKALLVEPCQKLKRLDDEIAVLQTALDKLIEERDAVSAFVDAHKALASPFRRLPVDIIEELFMACLPTHRNCVMSATEAPVILGRICRSWRRTAFGTPRLWARLHVVEPARPYSASVQAVRSQGRAAARESNLDHGITPPLTPPHFFPSPDLFLKALVPFAARWQDVRLMIPPAALERLSGLTEHDVPLLRSLKLVQRPEHPHSDTPWSLAPFAILRGPNVSRFSLMGGNRNPLDLPLRWDQLTVLSLMGPAWSVGHPQTCPVVLEILARCPKLQTCKLLVHGPPDGETLFPVPCPCLRALALVCVGTPLYTAGVLLSRLVAPALRDFKLGGLIEHPSVFSAEPLVRAFAPLEHLECVSIDTNTFSKAFLKDFLRGLPRTVRRLEATEPMHMWRPSLAEAALDDEVLAVLDERPVLPEGTTHCPALEELVIHHCRKVSDEALLRFVLSRAPTLRRVDVAFDREREVDIMPRLAPFVEAGGKVAVTYITIPPPQFSPWMGLPDAPLLPGMPPPPGFY
ncbi:hypothetical protein B0H14DRAFT_3454434 [Mycena olivaceomarginata]|nr:hypothetical protein B0H14DRAFT_3454434 [Mycena olivaceomarginata]